MKDVSLYIESDEDISYIDINYNYDGSIELVAFDEDGEMIDIEYAEIVKEG